MMVRAFIARGLLALLLVFAQQQAVLHELQHGTDAVAGKSTGSPLHDTCIKCLSFAGFDNAPAPSPVAFTAQKPSTDAVADAVPVWHTTEPFGAYLSRAPPSLS